MAYEFVYGTLDDASKAKVIDLQTKLKKLEELRAQIQTERAMKESKWNDKLTAIQVEENKIVLALRALRTVEMKPKVA